MDAIIERGGKVLLIERRNEPFGWALPGGFVDFGESVEEALAREVLEETALRVVEARQFHVYSQPGRDPRGIHVASVVFAAQAEGEALGGDDAKRAAFFGWDELPPLAFDHAQILEDYKKGLY